jgi:hypothetical protein
MRTGPVWAAASAYVSIPPAAVIFRRAPAHRSPSLQMPEYSGEKRPDVLRLHGLHQRHNTQDLHHALQILGKHVEAHLRADLRHGICSQSESTPSLP